MTFNAVPSLKAEQRKKASGILTFPSVNRTRRPCIHGNSFRYTEVTHAISLGCFASVAARVTTTQTNSLRYTEVTHGRWYLGINDEKPEDTKGHKHFQASLC